jgi:hypothetical protein
MGQGLMKPTRDVDLYIRWTTVTDGPFWMGTRADAVIPRVCDFSDRRSLSLIHGCAAGQFLLLQVGGSPIDLLDGEPLALEHFALTVLTSLTVLTGHPTRVGRPLSSGSPDTFRRSRKQVPVEGTGREESVSLGMVRHVLEELRVIGRVEEVLGQEQGREAPRGFVGAGAGSGCGGDGPLGRVPDLAGSAEVDAVAGLGPPLGSVSSAAK